MTRPNNNMRYTFTEKTLMHADLWGPFAHNSDVFPGCDTQNERVMSLLFWAYQVVVCRMTLINMRSTLHKYWVHGCILGSLSAHKYHVIIKKSTYIYLLYLCPDLVFAASDVPTLHMADAAKLLQWQPGHQAFEFWRGTLCKTQNNCIYNFLNDYNSKNTVIDNCYSNPNWYCLFCKQIFYNCKGWAP
jgi:hypothetical protein